MTVTEVVYCTRADVQQALNLADVPRLNERVDSAIMAGARQVEGFLHRRFYPETRTYKFDMPEDQYLWLYDTELSGTPTQILSGGDAMTVGTDVLLRPRTGPPYRWLEARDGGNIWWQAQDTVQDAIEVTGDFGYPVDTLAATLLAADVTAIASTLTVTNSGAVGVGSLILVGSERMIVSDQTLTDTTATLGADLDANKSQTSVTISSGLLVFPGEVITVGTEYMLIRAITSNTAIVDRAVRASVLAAHTSGAAIWAPRQCTIRRARLGTAAATHASADIVSLLQAPSLIRELNLAYAINNEQQSLAAYARTSGAADNRIDAVGRGLVDLEEDAYTAYGRKARSRAV
jgi:hypothetical protein